MHVELVELLRCPRAHESSALVAFADRSVSRVILDGVLSCPMCNAAFPIRGGITHFADAASPAPAPAGPLHEEEIDEGEAMRVAALLDAGPAKTVALAAGTVALARAVQRIAGARCFVLDAAGAATIDTPLPDDPPLGVLVTGGRLPVAPGTLHGVLVAPHPGIDVATVLDALRAGGRVVAPSTTPVPDGVREIARDERHWVGERVASVSAAPAALTQLRRRR